MTTLMTQEQYDIQSKLTWIRAADCLPPPGQTVVVMTDRDDDIVKAHVASEDDLKRFASPGRYYADGRAFWLGGTYGTRIIEAALWVPLPTTLSEVSDD